MIKLLSFGIAVSLTLSVSIAVILQLQSIALRRRFENNILAEELARYLCTTPWNPPLTYGLAYSHNGIVEPYNLSMTAWNQLQTIDYEEYRALSNITTTSNSSYTTGSAGMLMTQHTPHSSSMAANWFLKQPGMLEYMSS